MAYTNLGGKPVIPAADTWKVVDNSATYTPT
jgi:hypothetical protein